MDSVADNQKVSLPGAGETERTVLKEQLTKKKLDLKEDIDVDDFSIDNDKELILKTTDKDLKVIEKGNDQISEDILKFKFDEVTTPSVLSVINKLDLSEVISETQIEENNKIQEEGISSTNLVGLEVKVQPKIELEQTQEESEEESEEDAEEETDKLNNQKETEKAKKEIKEESEEEESEEVESEEEESEEKEKQEEPQLTPISPLELDKKQTKLSELKVQEEPEESEESEEEEENSVEESEEEESVKFNLNSLEEKPVIQKQLSISNLIEPVDETDPKVEGTEAQVLNEKSLELELIDKIIKETDQAENIKEIKDSISNLHPQTELHLPSTDSIKEANHNSEEADEKAQITDQIQETENSIEPSEKELENEEVDFSNQESGLNNLHSSVEHIDADTSELSLHLLEESLEHSEKSRRPPPPRPPLPAILKELIKEEVEQQTESPELLLERSQSEPIELEKSLLEKHKEEEHQKHQESRPPVPILTYQWEEVRRAKQRGGYPWTHLYKGPLGPEDEPEILLRYRTTPKIKRKTQEKLINDSPISEKKVIIIQFDPKLFDDLPSCSLIPTREPILKKTNIEENICQVEEKEEEQIKPSVSKSLKSILKRPHPTKLQLKEEKTENKLLRNSGEESPPKTQCCHPLVHKLKTMADKQFDKVKHNKNFRRIPLKGDQKITLEEDQPILRLRESPKAGRRERTSYIEKQDSDDFVDIPQLSESPGELRKHKDLENDIRSTTVTPDEIIELPVKIKDVTPEEDITEEEDETIEPTVSEILEEEMKNDPPLKAPRKKKEHVYEDIEDYFNDSNTNLDNLVDDEKYSQNKMDILESNNPIFESIISPNDIKISLQIQDEKILDEIDHGTNLDDIVDQIITDEPKVQTSFLAPISSIDSTSSDEDRRIHLTTLNEESDQASNDITIEDSVPVKDVTDQIIKDEQINKTKEIDEIKDIQKTPLSEKKVTFSPSTEDDPDLRKEDICVPKENIKIDSRWSKMSDHEYEPVGEPIVTSDINTQEQSTAITVPYNNGGMNITNDELDNNGAVGPNIINEQLQQKRRYSDTSSIESNERKLLRVPTEDDDDNISAEELQQQIEDRFFNKTPESPISNEIHTSQVDSSAIEDLPLKRESRSKSMMNSMHNKRKNMEEKIRSHAGRVKTKFRGMKKPSSESPKIKERKKFKTPEFAKKLKNIQMPKFNKPDIKRPEFTKIKMKKPDFKFPDFKRSDSKKGVPTQQSIETTEQSIETQRSIEETEPSEDEIQRTTVPKIVHQPQVIQIREIPLKDEQDKKPRFSIPDLPKFKIPDRFSSFKLHRSKSLKESTISSETTSDEPVEPKQKPTKKRFDFGTYPRIFGKKKKKPITNDSQDEDMDEIVHPVQFSTIPRSALKKQPQVTEWVKEDSESGKYKQYDDDINRAYRESSVEKRMRINEEMSREIEDNDDIEPHNLLSNDQKQMTDYDEENREIHVLSSARQDEFKHRKPIERQESDLNSEDEKILEWVKQETIKNKLLGREDSDLQSDEIDYKYGNNLGEFDNEDKELRGNTPNTNQETQSSGSSGLQRGKGILEEVDDDEFYLRKREDNSEENIPMTQYISSALREGLRDPEVNALAQVGQYDSYYMQNPTNDKFNRSMDSDDMPNHDYDHPRNLNDVDYRMDDEDNDEIHYRPRYIDESYKTYPPEKPFRRTKKQYSEDSQDQDDQHVPIITHERYYQHPVSDRGFYANEHMQGIEQPDIVLTTDYLDELDDQIIPYPQNVRCVYALDSPPKAPKRRKKNIHDFSEKIEVPEVHRSRFSPTYHPEDDIEDDIIVHRTEHEYLADTYQEPQEDLEELQQLQELEQDDIHEMPMPPPSRRSRSRSQLSKTTDDDRTSHGAESLASDAHLPIDEPKCVIDYRDSQGYAVVRKEPPPRPPAPLRRKRSTQSLVERQFFTMPMMKRDITPPSRPTRNYCTIAPNKPPRNKSGSSLNEPTRQASVSTPDVTEYEELDDEIENAESYNRDLQSGDIINKMKCRPLPPPPRPPRDPRKHKKSDKRDEDGGAERLNINAEFLDEERDVSELEESRLLTQTDPLQDDFTIQEAVNEERSSPTEPQTLQDILKKEQEAEIERARQLADAKNLERGIQRFRESSQRNYSERSRASTGDRPKTPSSRPPTPAAFLIERRISTPTSYDHVDQTLTHVKLTVLPIEIDNDDEVIDDIENIDNIDDVSNTDDIQNIDHVDNIQNIDHVDDIQNIDNIQNINNITNIENIENIENIDDIENSNNIEEMQSDFKQEQMAERTHGSNIVIDLDDDELITEEEEVKEINHDNLNLTEMKDSKSQLKFDLSNLEAEEDVDEVLQREVEHESDVESAIVDDTINKKTEYKVEDHEEEHLRSYVDEEIEPEVDLNISPPIAPPRRKSEVSQLPALPPRASEQTPPVTPPRMSSVNSPKCEEDHIKSDSSQHDAPPSSRLQISELEVDRLSVNALHANQIIVSDLQGVSVNAQELDCRSGNLVVRSIDLPPGFIEEIVDRIRTNERELIQQTEEEKKTQEPEICIPLQAERPLPPPPVANYPSHEEPPARPPPPQHPYFQEYFPFSMPPPSFYQLRNPSEEEPVSHTQTQRRRRHQRRKESTSEEEYIREQRRSRHETRSPEQSVIELSGQLARACSNVVSRTARQIMSYLRANSKDDNRRDLHFAIVIMIVIVAGLILFGLGGDRTVHHHHWDYFNPPGGEKTE